MKNKHFLFLISFLIILPFSARADYVGQQVKFFVDKDCSELDISQVSATLIKDSSKLYFYFEDNWWNQKNEKEKENINQVLVGLSSEFEKNIYPKLTSFLGSESIPGIDNDRKITILFYSTKEVFKGYTRNVDGYEKNINPESNQREMIYININELDGPLIKEYLAHEFTHLIQFNQKEKKIGKSEDVWLNEARAEYAITYLGYNNFEKNNYLKNRINDFLKKPSNPLTEWKGTIYDYGSINMFIHYLVDQYGDDVISDSLKYSSKIGIESINETLKNKGIEDDFVDIFSNWIVATYINDCSKNIKYCYKNENFKNIRVIPYNNFLPIVGESSLYVGQSLYNWSAHWQKFSGYKGDLKIKIENKGEKYISFLYVTRDYVGNYKINKAQLDNNGSQDLIIENMGTDISSVIIIPFVADLSDAKNKVFFYYLTTSTLHREQSQDNNQNQDINLPFETNKPLSQMNREELLSVLLRLIIYLLLQGKLHI